MYEGMRVNVDHDRSGSSDRPLRERFGVLRNVRYVECQGNFGDLHYLKSHPLSESVAEAAERMPETLGMSHDAYGRLVKHGQNAVVESIRKVRCVDLVGIPATTNGLFESEIDMDGDVLDPIDSVNAGFRSAVVAVLDGDGDVKSKVAKIKEILTAQEKAAAAISDDAEDVEPAESNDAGDSDMKATESQQAIAAKDAEIKRLQEQIASRDAADTVRKELSAAEIDADDRLVESLIAISDAKIRATLIEKMKPAKSELPPRSGVFSNANLQESEMQQPKNPKEFAALCR
jgi:hypothetical protein